jgi:CheY-like chemotaxis protein
MLLSLGHTVISVAEDGRQLVENCSLVPPDLVITDIFMPGMNGMEAAKAMTTTVSAPIILLSSNARRELIVEAEKWNIVTYLVKPLSKEALKAGIYLARTRLERPMLACSVPRTPVGTEYGSTMGVLPRSAAVNSASAIGAYQGSLAMAVPDARKGPAGGRASMPKQVGWN